MPVQSFSSVLLIILCANQQFRCDQEEKERERGIKTATFVGRRKNRLLREMMTTPSTTTTTFPNHDDNNNNNQKFHDDNNNHTNDSKMDIKNQYDFLLDRFRLNVKQSPDKLAVAYLSTTTNAATGTSSTSSTTTTPITVSPPYHVRIERQLTYSQLEVQTNEVAYQLVHHPNCKIQPGDR